MQLAKIMPIWFCHNHVAAENHCPGKRIAAMDKDSKPLA